MSLLAVCASLCLGVARARTAERHGGDNNHPSVAAGAAESVVEDQGPAQDVPSITLSPVDGASGPWVQLSDGRQVQRVHVGTWTARNLDILFEQASLPCAVEQGADFVLQLLVVCESEAPDELTPPPRVIEKIRLPSSAGPFAQGNLTVELEPGTHLLRLVLAGDRTCGDEANLACWRRCGIAHLYFVFAEFPNDEVQSETLAVHVLDDDDDQWWECASNYEGEIAAMHASLQEVRDATQGDSQCQDGAPAASLGGTHGAAAAVEVEGGEEVAEATGVGEEENDAAFMPLRRTSHSCVGVVPERDEAGGRTDSRRTVSDGMCLFRRLCHLEGYGLTYVMHERTHNKCVPRLNAVGRRWQHAEVEEFPMTVITGEGNATRCGGSSLSARQLPVAEWERVRSRVLRARRERRVHAYVRRFHLYNFGHVLADDAWPIFQGMVAFDALEYDSVVVISEGDGAGAMGVSYPSNKMFLTVSGNRLRTLRDYAHEDVCFDKFISGWGRYGYGNGLEHDGYTGTGLPGGRGGGEALSVFDMPGTWGQGPILRQWRNFVWRHYLQLMPPEPVRNRALAPWQLLLVEKDMHRAANKFRIHDALQLQRALQDHFPSAKLERVTWSCMPLRDQLLLLRQTHVVVALPGTDVMILNFLPDDSLVILPCRRVPNLGRWVPNDDSMVLWLNHAPHLRLASFCDHATSDLTPDGVYLDSLRLAHLIEDWLLVGS